jgi:hypothetical protein
MMANAREIIGFGPDMLVVKGANLPAAREAAGSTSIGFEFALTLAPARTR